MISRSKSTRYANLFYRLLSMYKNTIHHNKCSSISCNKSYATSLHIFTQFNQIQLVNIS